MQKWSSGDVVTAKLSLAVFDILCYNKMNYADKTKYPRTTARGEIQDVNKMGSRKPMKLNLGMAPKVIFIMMLDVLATVVSFFLGLWFRYDFSFAEIRPVHMEGFLSAIGLWCVITLLVFWIFRLYNSIWAFVSTPEVFRITGAYVVLGVIGVLVFHFDGNLMPRSSMVVGFLFSFVSTVTIRFSYRLLRTAQRRISHITHANGVKNVMLIGAGDAGRALAVEFTNSDHIQDHLSCVIDDNPVKWNKQLCGVPIVGGRQDIATAVKKYKISKIIFAIPNCTAKSRKEILDICATTGCEVQMLPGIFQMVNGEVSVSKLRKVDPQDLLGRDPIQVNLEEICGYINDKTVLVTGGGGSIGSELCRQIAHAKPKQLIILDIYENNAYDIQMELRRTHPELNLEVIIGSVRDAVRLNHVMETYRPELVFHAAAHKHVPLMETSPCEAIKNNVIGTYKLAKAAAEYGVKRFVQISTDKAVNPTNIMGASKRLCEMVIQMMNRESKTEFVAVRFGNVLGSNGSVIPLFKKQIEAGGPVTVTHPDIIRYFMTIPEAVSLVLQAGYYAKGGEIFILDMGEPVRIMDLAKKLIRAYGYEPNVDMPIKIIGLRPGEKLYEELLTDSEKAAMSKTAHDKIFVAPPIPMDDDRLDRDLAQLEKAAHESDEAAVAALMQVLPSYKPNRDMLAG